MPNITSVTNPVPGQENNTSYRSPITPNDTQVKNIPDPSRISRADQRTDRQDTAGSGLTRRYDSYFQAFLQDLRAFGSVSDSIYQLLASGLSASGAETAEVSAALVRIIQALQLNPEQLLALLKGQFSSGQRFRGPLFDVLRRGAPVQSLLCYEGGYCPVSAEVQRFRLHGAYRAQPDAHHPPNVLVHAETLQQHTGRTTGAA